MLVFFGGCATRATLEGQKTREIDKSWKNSCTFIGNSETSSIAKFGGQANYETVRNNIKNETAENGGNSYVVNSIIETSAMHYFATFEMYKCPENRYNLPSEYEALLRLKGLLKENVISQDEYDTELKKIKEAYSK